MTSTDRLDGLIDKIYVTALQPETCSDLVQAVGTTVGATSGTSLWYGRNGAELLHAHTWNVDPAAITVYEEQYLPTCPRLRTARTLPVGTVYDDRASRGSDDPKTRDYYAFMDRYDMGLARIALAEKRPELTINMCFHNRAQDGLVDEGERILTLLAPHFRRACNLVQRLGDVFERAAIGDAWFDARTASLTLDAMGLVVRANAAAESLLREADGLSLVRRRLVAGAAAEQDLLRTEIGCALGLSEPDRPANQELFVLISRPSGKPAFAVSVTPLPRGVGRERAIMTIASSQPTVAPETLQHAFGLTWSEACITAALVQGKSPEDVADARNVSLQTIRSQIKAIYAQLDVRSQAELVSRVTAAALGVRL